MPMHKFKELEIWKKAMDLTEKVYRLSSGFPGDERFGLISQIRRCAVSVPSNIAEEAGRNTNGEFNQFLGIALGSLSELETQMLLSIRVGFIQEEAQVFEEIETLRRMIFSFQKSMK